MPGAGVGCRAAGAVALAGCTLAGGAAPECAVAGPSGAAAGLGAGTGHPGRWPARPGCPGGSRRGVPDGAHPAGYPLRAALADGSLAAAVVTSGSAAARLRDVLAQAHVPQPPLVAIGPATARAAVDCGLVVAATAAHPDPGSVLDALRHAVSAPSPEET